MDWFSVLKGLAPMAPTLLGFVGGFIPVPGASLALSTLGSVVARSLGVPDTPEAVAAATQNLNDEKIAKINAALEEQKAKWAHATAVEQAWARTMEVGVAEVNATMRAELGHEHWFFNGWRPACGWILVINGLVFGIMLNYCIYVAAFWGRPEPLQVVADSWPVFLSYFGAIALIVGVYVFARSAEKTAMIGSGKAPVPTTSKSTTTAIKK